MHQSFRIWRVLLHASSCYLGVKGTPCTLLLENIAVDAELFNECNSKEGFWQFDDCSPWEACAPTTIGEKFAIFEIEPVFQVIRCSMWKCCSVASPFLLLSAWLKRAVLVFVITASDNKLKKRPSELKKGSKYIHNFLDTALVCLYVCMCVCVGVGEGGS